MVMFHHKKPPSQYRIVFCDEPNLSTRFGQDSEIFDTYKDAEYRIHGSKLNGWRNAIISCKENAWQVDGGWLMIEKIDEVESK